MAFVELELTRLVLCEVGKVERYPHKVTLGSIIALIVVIIDDHIVAIIFRSRHILEVVKVERVGQNVVRVDALQRLARCLLRAHHRVELALSQQLHVERVATVSFLTLGPFAVLVVQTRPIVVNVLIQLDIADGQLGEVAL